jgi:hypothetical protein
MKYLIFNKKNGAFAALMKDGIVVTLDRAEVNSTKILEACDKMDKMEVGQYFYVADFVITRVTAGL